MIWFNIENVSQGLAVQINTIKPSNKMSPEAYFANYGYIPQALRDTAIKNATEVNIQGITGVKIVTMTHGGQYSIILAYKGYLIEIVVIYGSPAGPNKMTDNDNRFIDTFLSRFTFIP